MGGTNLRQTEGVCCIGIRLGAAVSRFIAYVVSLAAVYLLAVAYLISKSTDVHFALNAFSSIALFLGSVLFLVMGAAFIGATDE